ncbi:Maf family nucleotide pyrophosphatase [Pseudoalteromonas xiamenensis]|uniref:Maf family protein n=1 Tax=Pseudoalteromonas xiamenensis TaxID=882626 RepID=UPI0027E5891D|nr:Maf family protein [Pseudoalteromonas xiamenensis]WMN61293.1 Maf family nucleotide pyrophosphatase [Pseudoalteromonas xiamenensis]
MARKIYLASASPRRRELVEQLGYQFEQFSVDADESLLGSESPRNYVERLARLKAESGVALGYRNYPVLGSDTSVVVDGQILGKPENYEDFQRMMTLLSGRTHEVLTGIAFATEHSTISDVVVTQVTFKALSEAEVESYWQTGEPADKAGGYGIQGFGGRFVTNLEGSYFAVMGLPLYETDRLLTRFLAEAK